MTTLSMAAISSVPTAQRFGVDSEVKDLEKEFRKRDRSLTRWGTMMIMLVISGVVVRYVPADFIKALDEPSFDSVMTAVGSAVVTLMVLCFGIFVFLVTGATENKARKSRQTSLKRSLKAARSLSDAVPLLTKEHVEMGMRFDDAMDDQTPPWTAEDMERIRPLLLADLDQAETIMHLIEARGLSSVDEVVAALAEMDALGKPLQDGWL